jgi:hypothetical protein
MVNAWSPSQFSFSSLVNSAWLHQLTGKASILKYPHYTHLALRGHFSEIAWFQQSRLRRERLLT